MRTILGFSGLAALLIAAGSAFAGTATPVAPDLILFNGDLFTNNPAQPRAQAIAIRGERIVAVGDNAEIAALAGTTTRRIDLKGRTVIPGINDAHEHLWVQPADTYFLQLEGGFNPDWPSLRKALAEVVATEEKSRSLSATIGSTIFYDTKIDRDALDQVAPEHPVILQTFDGHGMLLNSAALARYGIDEDSADPLGGRFERDANGRLTGVLREYANWKVSMARGHLTPDADGIEQLRWQLLERAKLGITTTQTMPVGMDVARNAALLRQATTPIRVRIIAFGSTTPAGRATQAGQTPRHPAPLVEVTGQKWVLDGVGLEGSLTPRAQAAQSLTDPKGPYSVAGLPALFDRAEIEAILRETLQGEEQLLVHVFGRPAIVAMLDAMEATGGAKVWAPRRVRFEHAEGLSSDLLPRAKALGVVVSQQPSHMDLRSLGHPEFAERVAHDQLLRSLLEAGIPVALGSDGAVNPYLGVLLASLHPNHPDEAITREQAVMGYTMGSAYAEFAEKDKGSLELGKLADLVVLSQDIFRVPPPELPKTTSLLTIVGGKTAWDSGELREQD